MLVPRLIVNTLPELKSRVVLLEALMSVAAVSSKRVAFTVPVKVGFALLAFDAISLMLEVMLTVLAAIAP